MFFLNLTAAEFFALLGVLSSVITALYLLDRRKRRRVVATLRFWAPAALVDERRSRRHMQQPWSLLLQLLSVALLLLAIAQLQCGSRPARARNHVLLLDTSAWSGAHIEGNRTVLDRERQLVREYLRTLPATDRILLLKTDALASPAAAFTSDRKIMDEALRAASPGWSALDLNQALAFARGAQAWSAGTPGEIVYFGPARDDRPVRSVPVNLRVLLVPVSRENCGIRAAGVKRNEEQPNSWNASFTLGNDGRAPRRIELDVSFAGTRFAPRPYVLQPGDETVAEYRFLAQSGGSLTATIAGSDAIRADDRVEMTLPANAPVRLMAYTRRRDVLQPLLDANHELTVEYLDPALYRPDVPRAAVVVFDEFSPAQRPVVPSLWLHPPREMSPLPVKSVVHDAALAGWHAEALGDSGLRAREMRFPQAEVFQTFKGDTSVASVAAGPVVVMRNSNNGSGTAAQKLAVVGFDLLAKPLRTDLTTPLLVANLLHWLSPDAFRPVDFAAEHVGAVTTPLEAGETAETFRVTDETGAALPFSVRNRGAQLFVGSPQRLRLESGIRKRILSVTLPDVARDEWVPPASTRRGLPGAAQVPGAAVDLWQWLAVLGGLGLLIEWLLFGRRARVSLRSGTTRRQSETAAPNAKEKEGVPA